MMAEGSVQDGTSSKDSESTAQASKGPASETQAHASEPDSVLATHPVTVKPAEKNTSVEKAVATSRLEKGPAIKTTTNKVATKKD